MENARAADMTCGEFSRRLETVLSGDTSRSRVRTGAVHRHLAACPACSSAWERVSVLVDFLRETDTSRDADAAVVAAREHLRAAFGRRGQPVVRFGSLRTPIGRLFVGVSDQGVYDITLGDPGEERYRQQLLERAPEAFPDPGAVEPALTELDAYFQGRLERFTLAVDLRGVTAFTQRVLRVTRKIRFGQLLSYGDVARRIRAPRASRAVGGALGRNPVPIIVPCHRVVARGGGLGGFTGGLDAKRALLSIEGHPARLPV